jgi:hypothetical protein
MKDTVTIPTKDLIALLSAANKSSDKLIEPEVDSFSSAWNLALDAMDGRIIDLYYAVNDAAKAVSHHVFCECDDCVA